MLSVENNLQLALNQRDIWYKQTMHLKSPLFNIGGTCIFNGSIDYNMLNKAIQQLIIENDTLRINISNQAPYTQTLINQYTYKLEFVDFSKHASAAKKAHAWLDDNFKRPFTFNKNHWLWQFALIKESSGCFYLMTKYHHVILDGGSVQLVIIRLSELYNALLEKQSIEIKPIPSYFDFIKQEQKYLGSSHYQVDDKYWSHKLPELPSTLISRRYPDSVNSILPKAHNHRFKIKREFYENIRQFSVHNDNTIVHTFLGVIGLYFSRIYQREDICIGIPVINRSGARYKKTLGMFTNLSPLVLEITQSDNTHQLLQHCKSQLRELYKHHRFPLNHIKKRLNLLQKGRNQLFDIVFSYEKFDFSASFGGVSQQAKQYFSDTAGHPLIISICEFNNTDDVEVIFEGAENCFTREDLLYLENRFLVILQQMLDKPNKVLKDFNLLTINDTKIIFETFNRNIVHQKEVFNVIQLFQQQVKQRPHQCAVEFQKHTLSYQKLDQLSSQLAQHLLDQGIKTNDMIAIHLPRSVNMIIGILAILKTSAAYLPIPTDSPNQRIEFIFEQSQTKILLTDSHYSAQSPHHPQIICIDDYQTTSNNPLQPLENINIKPENLAYVIFTSGTTGSPKGVMVEHKALSSRLNWLQSLFKLSPNDRMGQTIQYYFDPSIIEIFVSLSQGASLIIAPENSNTPQKFSQFILDQKITSLALVPSTLRILLAGLKENKQKTKLRFACCGGERLEAELAEQFIQQTSATLYNVYGPTEATIIATAWKCQKHFKDKVLPLGKPADNTQILICDENLEILPVNEIGEIIICGDTLTKGYINQPRLNKKTFPSGFHNHSRLYKTGDMGYINNQGLLYFSGRIDRQVKISGYRIELSEIENILQDHDHVSSVAVTTPIFEHQKQLIAYVETKREDTDTLLKELSFLLRQHLPSYMQPRAIIPLTTIKTSQTGKIDYSSLPLPDLTVHLNKEYAPHNLLETQLLQLWKNTLSINKIGMNDNFFESGGDSISAVRLMIAIETITGVLQPLSFLLENPSIATQASALYKTGPNNSLNLLISLSAQKNTLPFFIAASGTGDYLRFSKLADCLKDNCSVHMLQPAENHNPQSIHSIAQTYADNIIQHCNAPYYLSGFSIGGITALETARILIKQGRPPLGVILFDSIFPRWPLQSLWLFKFLGKIVNLCNLREKIINNRHLEVMINDPGIITQVSALSEHTIKTVDLPIDLILTKKMWMFHPLIRSSWAKLFKNQLTKHSVNGLHGEMFQEPYVQELAKLIKTITTLKERV